MVGIDENTDLDVALDLADRSLDHGVPIVFGALYSEGRAGKYPRYPSISLIGQFLQKMSPIRKTSIHLCGMEAIASALSFDKKITSICDMANYIQLNLSLKDFNDQEKLARDIILFSEKSGKIVILQENKSKEEFNHMVRLFSTPRSRLLFLHDTSLGSGNVIEHFPLSDEMVGYSGGISQDNVVDIISKIDDKQAYYLDMESGIRTNDVLDFDKCKEIWKKANHIH
jgi:hypothetical protein